MKKFVFPTVLFLTLSSFASAADLQFAVIGDAGKKNSSTEAVRASIKQAGVADLILPGDNLYESTYAKVWGKWVSDGFRFLITAIGNHNAGYAQEMAFFGMSAEYYSKKVGDNVKFIVLNSDNQNSVNEQATFLDEALQAAQEPFVFVVYHHPSYTLSHFHGWREKQAFQIAVRPLLFKHRDKITGLLVGHDHLALLAHFADIPVVLSGAVGEARPDTPINNTQDGVVVTTNWSAEAKPFWAKLSIPSGANAAKVEYIRATDNAVKCSATITTGQSAVLSSDCD